MSKNSAAKKYLELIEASKIRRLEAAKKSGLLYSAVHRESDFIFNWYANGAVFMMTKNFSGDYEPGLKENYGRPEWNEKDFHPRIYAESQE